MSSRSREFFQGTKYFFADVIAFSKSKEDWVLAVDKGGETFVGKPSLGNMARTNEDPNTHEWHFLGFEKNNG